MRKFSDAKRRFEYVHEARHYAVCWPCRAKLARGASVTDVKRRRGVVILVGAIVLAVLAAALTPGAMPSLMSAFWQAR